MAVIGNSLFGRLTGSSVDDIVRQVGHQLPQRVDQYDEHKFENQTDEEVVQALARELSIEPIALDYDNVDKKVQETRVRVRDEFENRPIEVQGLRVTKTFPFTGSQELWNCGTGSWTTSMPRGQVHGRSITIGMEVRASAGEEAAKHINSTVEQIEGYLDKQKKTLDQFNSALPDRLLPLVQARRERRGGAQSLLDKF